MTPVRSHWTTALPGSTTRTSDRWAGSRSRTSWPTRATSGAARVALGLASTTNAAAGVLKATWDKLGIGRPTGIDLANEASGIVHDPAIQPWAQVDLANASFGQGVAVTLIQLASAYSAMVNGGNLITPHVVAAIGNQPVAPTPGAQVISPTIAATLTNLMTYVVHTVPWYRANTLVKGYVVGGKTGTAQIWDPTLNHGHGGWMTTRYNNTFVGYIGRNAPDLVIAVQIHEGKPLVIRQGDLPLAVESYELFRRIATDSMSMLDLTPTGPRAGGQPESVTAARGTLAAVTDPPGSQPPPGSDALDAPELARLSGGTLVHDSGRPIRGAAVDSRRVQPGNLFVALPGERTDGHEHLADALANGAAAVLISRPGALPEALHDVSVVRVNRPIDALGAIAAGWRARFELLTVGITGSIAKTSTKEVVAAVLASRFRTRKSEGNENNEIGLPLTVLRIDRAIRRSSWRWACISAARSPTWPGSPGPRSGWSPRSSRSISRGSVRSRRSSRPRASSSRPSPPRAPRSSTATTNGSPGWPAGRPPGS